jgi:hypothetical protein
MPPIVRIVRGDLLDQEVEATVKAWNVVVRYAP